jgi:hypothetical protein
MAFGKWKSKQSADIAASDIVVSSADPNTGSLTVSSSSVSMNPTHKVTSHPIVASSTSAPIWSSVSYDSTLVVTECSRCGIKNILSGIDAPNLAAQWERDHFATFHKNTPEEKAARNGQLIDLVKEFMRNCSDPDCPTCIAARDHLEIF